MDHFVKKRKRENNDTETESQDGGFKTKKEKQGIKLTRIYPKAENLNIEYGLLYSKTEADELVRKCEDELQYNEGKLTEVFVFGKWHKVPRKQVAYGDQGLSYKFSGTCVPALPWPSFVEEIKNRISDLTGYKFNFVLINRYKDGNDHMGEHRDDEHDLVYGHPVASLSLGQPRDFVFRHCDSRGKNAKRKIDPVKIVLEHGSLLMMLHPTNTYWYHSLPPRKSAPGVRINMTFRMMNTNVANRVFDVNEGDRSSDRECKLENEDDKAESIRK